MNPRDTIAREVQPAMMRDLSYNSVTGEIVWRHGRGKAKTGSVAGTLNREGYVQIGYAGRVWVAHRVAWLLHFGRWPANGIDHINGDKADNRISNLRECTNGENLQNSKTPTSNTSGFLGVSLDKRTNKWRAAIKFNGKTYSLGQFDDPKEAHKAYLEGKQRFHRFSSVARDSAYHLISKDQISDALQHLPPASANPAVARLRREFEQVLSAAPKPAALTQEPKP